MTFLARGLPRAAAQPGCGTARTGPAGRGDCPALGSLPRCRAAAAAGSAPVLVVGLGEGAGRARAVRLKVHAPARRLRGRACGVPHPKIGPGRLAVGKGAGELEPPRLGDKGGMRSGRLALQRAAGARAHRLQLPACGRSSRFQKMPGASAWSQQPARQGGASHRALGHLTAPTGACSLHSSPRTWPLHSCCTWRRCRPHGRPGPAGPTCRAGRRLAPGSLLRDRERHSLPGGRRCSRSSGLEGRVLPAHMRRRLRRRVRDTQVLQAAHLGAALPTQVSASTAHGSLKARPCWIGALQATAERSLAWRHRQQEPCPACRPPADACLTCAQRSRTGEGTVNAAQPRDHLARLRALWESDVVKPREGPSPLARCEERKLWGSWAASSASETSSGSVAVPASA